MTYEQILQRAPLSTEAGDTDAAERFVAFLSSIIEGDRQTFTQLEDSQQRYLYKLRSKWQERAKGLDERWNTYGSRPGRPVSTKTPKRKRRRSDPGETTALFQSLMRKFGTPRDLVDDDE